MSASPGPTSWPTRSREVVAPLAEQAAAGTLRVHVATRLPLDEATDGLATIAAGQAHGKIVVTIAD